MGTSGVKYVRWGRTTCPSGAQVVYKGIYIMENGFFHFPHFPQKLYVSDIRCFYHTIITRDRSIMENCGVILSRA